MHTWWLWGVKEISNKGICRAVNQSKRMHQMHIVWNLILKTIKRRKISSKNAKGICRENQSTQRITSCMHPTSENKTAKQILTHKKEWGKLVTSSQQFPENSNDINTNSTLRLNMSHTQWSLSYNMCIMMKQLQVHTYTHYSKPLIVLPPIPITPNKTSQTLSISSQIDFGSKIDCIT